VSGAGTIQSEICADGVLHLKLCGEPSRLDEEFCAALEPVIAHAKRDDSIRGIVVSAGTPGKFAAGESPESILALRFETAAQARAHSDLLSMSLRNLETCGKPVACAIEGAALDGGLELALACHYRVMLQRSQAVLGMPGIHLGLVPAAGGTQRLPRLAGVRAGLRLLLEGKLIRADEASELRIVDRVAIDGDAVSLAAQWVLENSAARARWDVKGFQVPGGAGCLAPHAVESFQAGTSRQARATSRNDPAPLAILAAAFEGTQLPMDTALRVESKYYARVMTQPVARNRIRTGVVVRNEAQRLLGRPQNIPTSRTRRLAVVGAGLMGSGIARIAAANGIDVWLLDATQEQAQAALAGIESRLAQECRKGTLSEDRARDIAGRIQPTVDYRQLADADLCIEAVFERRSIKTAVIERLAEVAGQTAVLATNTSTLSVGSLGAVARDPRRFIGLHFFSPVERMPLVEVIVSDSTSPQTLARGLDFVAQLGKTPVVVHDHPGFYTSRVFGTYVDEGMAMLAQGIEPALIENAARLAGMPVGPLAVCDEVGIQLQLAVHEQAVADSLPERFQRLTAIDVVRRMVNELGRTGRRGNGGFYDYPAEGRKRLWPGLRQHFPVSCEQPDVELVKHRLLHIQALESVRCLDEGVISRPQDADLASVLGIGFPAWTGGALSWIATHGASRFFAECADFALSVGPRFQPPTALLGGAYGLDAPRAARA
jgi:3-hydroxyacyl-CoA dehydrogenase/enoyl-CoA hydratase/3-hydroxybutyryl-CoA epimerase